MSTVQTPVDERNLNPDEVAALDYRRQMGLVFQVICGQMTLMSVLLTWWIGQDLVYANPHGHLITIYFCITATLAIFFGISGTAMRRGVPRLE